MEKNANWFEICQNKQIPLAMTFRNDSFAWVQGVTNTKKLSKQFTEFIYSHQQTNERRAKALFEINTHPPPPPSSSRHL